MRGIAMSRIGIKPIPVPGTVQVDIAAGNAVKVKGPKGELSQQLTNKIKLVQEEGQILVQRESEDREIKALHGLTRSLLNNMVVGVTDGYTRVLEIQGVGYRAQLQGKNLVLNVSFSHP